MSRQKEKYHTNTIRGMKTNSITALSPKRDSKKHLSFTKWNCICDCGKILVLNAIYFYNPDRSTCGCSRINDITNQRFGMLLAVEKTKSKNKSGSSIWKCVCDCGKISCLQES